MFKNKYSLFRYVDSTSKSMHVHIDLPIYWHCKKFLVADNLEIHKAKKKKPLFPVVLPTLIFWCRP